MHITDRAKDMVRSGGEWISSIELENAAVGHPALAEAAVIAAPHPKWGERPLLVAVRRPEAEVAKAEILEFLAGKVAKWWLPDDVVFVDELPHTATGKIRKSALRERFGTTCCRLRKSQRVSLRLSPEAAVAESPPMNCFQSASCICPKFWRPAGNHSLSNASPSRVSRYSV